MQIYIIISLLIALSAVTFALQNPGIITIKFLMWEFSGSLALVLLAIFAMGFISSFLISGVSSIRRKFRESDDRRPPPPDDNSF